MATEKVTVVRMDTAPAQKSVKELRSELKELKDQLLSTEQGTEEYNKTMARAAEIQHTLKEQMEEVNANAMDFGQIASNITKSVGGIVGGFQAAKAAMNMFGIENEAVLKSMEKMQNLMAITQALPAIDSGIKAFKRLSTAIKGTAASMNGLKAALVSTGIGALVVALGALLANWDKVTDAVKRFTDANYAAKKSQEELAQKIEETEKRIASAKGKLEEWEASQDYAKMNKKAREAFDEYKTQLEGVNIALELYRAEEKKAEEEMLAGASRRAKGEEWKGLKQAYNNAAEARKNAEAQVKALQQALEDLRAAESSYTKDEEKTVSTTKEHVETLEELIARTTEWLALQTKEGETHTAVAEAIRKRKQELQELRELETEDEDTSFEDNFRKKVEDTVNSLRQAFTTPEEQYQQELNALEVWKNTELMKFRDNEEKKYQILQEYAKLRDALNKEQTQREIQRYALAANSIGSIFSSLGELMEEGSEEQKALQIMGATINMLGGITAAIAGAFTTHSGPWDIALAAIQATAIAATGAATIAKMAQTNKSNAASTASVNTGAMATVIAPVQYTSDVRGAEIEGAIRDTKVYVTESDITNTQNKVRVSENEATF